MKSPRIFLALTAAALVLAACELTPTGGVDAPSAPARFNGGPAPADSTGDGVGTKGGGG